MAPPTTIEVSDQLKISVELNQWGKPTANMRSARSDKSFKNFYVSQAQWGRITTIISQVTPIIAQLNTTDEDGEIEIPVDDQKMFTVKKENGDMVIHLVSVKNGAIQQGLNCCIGGIDAWASLTMSQTRVTMELDHLAPNQNTHQRRVQQYKWIGVNKNGSGVTADGGDAWCYVKKMAQSDAEGKVSGCFCIFHLI